jgi:hypothetical protein
MRTRAQWETEINGSATTNGLTLSSSGTAEWKLWRDLTITIAMFLEGIFSIFKSEVDNHLAQEQHGGIYWYGQIAKEFQYGDSLTVVDGIVQYVPVNVSHRLVTQVSVKEVNDDVLVMKVAKGSGSIVKLTGPEFTAFKSYITKRKLPGTKINMYTLDGNSLYIDNQIFYDPLVDPANLQTEIFAALDEFAANFEFDDMLYRSAIVAVIMGVPGVVGMSYLGLEIDYVSFGDYVELSSGYFTIDPLSTFSLSIAP